jgi:phosphoglycolate phosphatase-like HAD superfamily hydrolase
MATSPAHVTPPAFLFDLDGTLVDSVYQHVLAWREALEHTGMELSVWRIHRRIGMSGGLLVNALLRETGQDLTPGDAERLRKLRCQKIRLSSYYSQPFCRAYSTEPMRITMPHAICQNARVPVLRSRSAR